MTAPVTIKTYQPAAQILLYKTISRTTTDGKSVVSQRFQGAAQNHIIDLTPFLSDTTAVRTSKSRTEPAGGFSITLADKPALIGGGIDSIYGFIEPMDMIEIRLRHSPPNVDANNAATYGADPQRPTIIMRGFVSDITRTLGMSAEGRPQRNVIISGQDYGKIWQMLQINTRASVIVGDGMISSFKLFERYGVGFQTVQSPADFVNEVILKVLDIYLNNLMPSWSVLPRAFTADISVPGGRIDPAGAQNEDGTIYHLLSNYGDVGVWNELFIEDREVEDGGVAIVYRPVPYYDVSTGALIQAGAAAPLVIDIDAVDVVQMNVTRSDRDVANFYWVEAQRFDLANDNYRILMAQQTYSPDGRASIILEDYENAMPSLYGNRIMTVSTEQGGDDMQTFNSGLPADPSIQQGISAANWTTNRRQTLVAMNKDNVLFEHGTMRLRGNEFIRAAMYLRLHLNGFVCMFYVDQVDHEYIPYTSYTTTVQVSRGTGFVERIKLEGGQSSPYLLEMKRG